MKKLPRLHKPRFELAQRHARMTLAVLHHPKPPVPLIDFVKLNNWKVVYTELFGPDGYMTKSKVRGKNRFGIYIATDLDSQLTPLQVERCQFWTLAHEIGHILLHGEYILNSLRDEDTLDQELQGILEVEAHWFASRLLIPDYVFIDALDLNPLYLADKCLVNFSAAQKRIDGLNPAFRRQIESVLPREWIEARQSEKLMAKEKIDRIAAHRERRMRHNYEMIDLLRRHFGYE